jgi:AcrR family transcriptional regulator
MLKEAIKLRPGTATYARGRESVQRILEAAKEVFLAEGYSAVSMRRIARDACISPSNLNYYYASKDDLIADLLQGIIGAYLEEFDSLRHDAGTSPEDQFRAVLGFVIDDLADRQTTLFFPELWALANRSERTTAQMEDLYSQYRHVIAEVIAEINPELSAERIETLALFISSSIEGHTVFIGDGRPHRAKGAEIKEIATETFLRLVKEAA